MTDSDIADYIHVLRGWEKYKDDNCIKGVLQRCQKVTKDLEETDLTSLVDSLTVFHKAINKAEKVDEEWFKQVQTAKKHIRKLLDQKKRQQALMKQPKLIKSNSKIQFPQNICSDLDCHREKEFLKLLYKSFLLNLEEKVQQKNKQIIKFLKQVVEQMAKDIGYSFESMTNPQEKSKLMMKRANDVASELGKINSSSGKMEMIEGKKPAKGVAKLEEQAYEGEELRRLRAERLKAIATENQTGFYDEMKKNINKDAKEECRFCHKLAAYCEDMKQIRASDEPMTRFMFCNACNKRWRQQ